MQLKDAQLFRQQAYIDGAWVDADGVAFHGGGRGGYQAWPEGAAFASLGDLEVVAVKVEGVGAGVVVVDCYFDGGVECQDAGVDVAVDGGVVRMNGGWSWAFCLDNKPSVIRK